MDGDAAVASMDPEFCFDRQVVPLLRPVHEETRPPVLHDPVGLRAPSLDVVDRIHPGPPPRFHALARSSEPRVRRAAPREVIEEDGRGTYRVGGGVPAVTSRPTSGWAVRPRPGRPIPGRRSRPGRRGHRGADEPRRAIAGGVPNRKTDADRRGIVAVRDDARGDRLARVQRRTREQVVGPEFPGRRRGEGRGRDAAGAIALEAGVDGGGLRVPVDEWPGTFETSIMAPSGSGWKPCTAPGSSKWKRAPPLGGRRGRPASARPMATSVRLAHRVGDRAAAVGGRQVQAVGDRPAPVGAVARASMPARPLLIPSRQPTLPELQSVSQPAVLTIISDCWKSPSPYSSAMDDQRVVRARRGSCRRICRSRSAPRSARASRASRARWRRQSRMSAISRRMIESPGMSARPVSSSWSRSRLDEGLRLHRREHLRAIDRLAVVADAGRRGGPGRRRARDRPGATIAQPSMKICAPICSATTLPLSVDRAAARGRDARPSGAGRRCARWSCPCRPTTGSSAAR